MYLNVTLKRFGDVGRKQSIGQNHQANLRTPRVSSIHILPSIKFLSLLKGLSYILFIEATELSFSQVINPILLSSFSHSEVSYEVLYFPCTGGVPCTGAGRELCCLARRLQTAVGTLVALPRGQSPSLVSATGQSDVGSSSRMCCSCSSSPGVSAVVASKAPSWGVVRIEHPDTLRRGVWWASLKDDPASELPRGRKRAVKLLWGHWC